MTPSKNSWFKSYSAVGLLSVSIVKHYLTKLLNLSDHFSGCVSPLGGLSLILYIATQAKFLEKGGLPSASSIQVIPTDHISVL